MKQKGFVTPLLILVLIIFILVFGYFFVASPHKAVGKPVKPFKEGEYFLSEKITYLFRKPEVGDRIIFIPNNTGNDFLGIITKVEEDNNVKIYTVISGGTKPWIITQDKITGRIYYPFLSKEEILANLPSPSPSSIDNSQESTPSAETADWKTYTVDKYSFTYPSEWRVQAIDYLNTKIVISNDDAVQIKFSDQQYPFGIEDPNTKLETQELKVAVDGKEYNIEEAIVNNSSAFINFKTDSPNIIYIYATYKKGQNYQNSKNNIVKLLSTFKFAN